MYVCMYVCMYVRMYVCMYVYVHVFMYVCTCMHIGTNFRGGEHAMTLGAKIKWTTCEFQDSTSLCARNGLSIPTHS